MLSSVREYKKASLWCPVFVVLEVLMEVLVPGVMALIIDKGINGGSINYILKVGAVLILMSMLALFSESWQEPMRPKHPRAWRGT